MTRLATVLVPLDGSIEATAALPVARGLAALCEATLAVVHVTHEVLEPAALAARVHLTADDVPGLVVDRCTGMAAAAIAREAAARNAAFIVMCARTHEHDEPRTWGRVAAGVLSAARCPVVFVPAARGRRPWALRRVLFPHDGTPTSAAALGPVAALAERAGAEVVVLHVAAPDAERPAERGTLLSPRYVDQPQHEWPAWSREFLDRVCGLAGAARPARLRVALVEGDPGAAIVDFARADATDLITVAWRGDLAPERARAMRRVIRDVGCPVMVLRVPAPATPAPAMGATGGSR